MTITTKYDVGMELWFLDYYGCKVRECKIIGVIIERNVISSSPNIMANCIKYLCKSEGYKSAGQDDGLFTFNELYDGSFYSSKAELLKSLE